MELEKTIAEIKKEIACNNSSIKFCQQKEDCENYEFYHENLKVSDLLPFLEELKRRRELSERNRPISELLVDVQVENAILTKALELSCIDRSNYKELVDAYLEKARKEND